MNKVFLLPVAAMFVVACAEPTAPSVFAISAAKQTTPAPVNLGETFESLSSSSLSAWNTSSIDLTPGSSQMTPTHYLGRLLNQPVTLTAGQGMATVTISFDLYIIGTWDGAGLQGFGGDFWQIAVSRNGGPLENVFHTSFSNQATKPQNFPKQIDGGTSPNGRGAYLINALGYPKASGKFDVGDAIYRLSYTVSNPTRGAMVFYFQTTTPLQSLSDESWGLDNVSVTGN